MLIQLAQLPVYAEAWKDYDLIIPDQRGTGGSTPSFTCPAPSLDLWTFSRASIDATNKCFAASLLTGVSAKAYSTTEAARDVWALIQATKVAGGRTVVHAFSYGTLLAQRLMQVAPEGSIDMLLLEGVVSPLSTLSTVDSNSDSAGRRILQSYCGASCKASMGRLEGGGSTATAPRSMDKLLASFDTMEANKCMTASFEPIMKAMHIDTTRAKSTVHTTSTGSTGSTGTAGDAGSAPSGGEAAAIFTRGVGIKHAYRTMMKLLL
jgi:pimeloyl-ACP methyl ester carboxylesterase